jgi:hypothetical protein
VPRNDKNTLVGRILVWAASAALAAAILFTAVSQAAKADDPAFCLPGLFGCNLIFSDCYENPNTQSCSGKWQGECDCSSVGGYQCVCALNLQQ